MLMDASGTPLSGGGAPPPLPQTPPHPDANGLPEPSTAIDSPKQTWQQLIDRTTPQDELPLLIETIFSDRKTIKMVGPLQESDAQAFIDVIDGVRHHVPDF